MLAGLVALFALFGTGYGGWVVVDGRYAKDWQLAQHKAEHAREVEQFNANLESVKTLILRQHRTELVNTKSRLERLGAKRSTEEDILYNQTLQDLQDTETELARLGGRRP